MAKQFSASEVANHNTATDCWIIISGKVYDVTQFLNEHPGGKKVLLKFAGKDATEEFNNLHNVAEVMKKYGPQLCIGNVGDGKQSETAPTVAKSAPSPKQKMVGPEAFGELVPFGDPTWYQEWKSPYYSESHKKWRAALRQFVDKEVTPHCHDWDENKRVPIEMWNRMYTAGILPAVIGSPWPVEYVGDNLAGGVKAADFDYFHEMIMIDELARCGSAGVLWAFQGGLAIGLPPIRNFGSQYLKDKCMKECLMGNKIICLAITEPYAGSDVANLLTTAKKTADGKHYIVNGEKKWITNGVFADYFTVAVRTGGEGMGGVSLLLVEKKFPGVTTRQMQCSGVWPSGTTYITFEDVKVPVENLIGKENEGFKYVMYNFNHERWAMCCQATRFARVCYEEAFKYAHKRKTFGKFLIEHPVIRMKLANMARLVEATYAWLESVTYQLSVMTKQESALRLGGPIALLKAQTTTTFEYCAREAAQIFGGLSYTRGGQGEKVERLYREVRAYAIPGGSEEIMLDLGMRQATKVYTTMSKV